MNQRNLLALSSPLFTGGAIHPHREGGGDRAREGAQTFENACLSFAEFFDGTVLPSALFPALTGHSERTGTSVLDKYQK